MGGTVRFPEAKFDCATSFSYTKSDGYRTAAEYDETYSLSVHSLGKSTKSLQEQIAKSNARFLFYHGHNCTKRAFRQSYVQAMGPWESQRLHWIDLPGQEPGMAVNVSWIAM